MSNEDQELSEVHICQGHSAEDQPVKWPFHTHREALHTRQCNRGVVGGERTCGGEQWNIAAGMLQTTLSLWVWNAPQLKGVHECYMVFTNFSKTHMSSGVSASWPETAEVERRPAAEGYHASEGNSTSSGDNRCHKTCHQLENPCLHVLAVEHVREMLPV